MLFGWVEFGLKIAYFCGFSFNSFCAFQQNSKTSLTNQKNTQICHKLKSNGSFDKYKSRAFQICPDIFTVSVCRWEELDL